MIRFVPLASVALTLALARPLQAHQLDEYLQAARLDFSPAQIVVELSLTPGVAIAPQVFALIDRDGDHLVVQGEIDDYARRVLADLTLSIDDRPYPLMLISAQSPSWSEMREGTGTIRLEAIAAAPLGRGHHRVFFGNTHEPASSVYLVNALKPSARGMTIGAPRRDVLQRHVDFDVEVAGGLNGAMWVGLASLVIALLTLARRSRPRRQAAAATTPSVG
jgi:hypothetical protein